MTWQSCTVLHTYLGSLRRLHGLFRIWLYLLTCYLYNRHCWVFTLSVNNHQMKKRISHFRGYFWFLFEIIKMIKNEGQTDQYKNTHCFFCSYIVIHYDQYFVIMFDYTLTNYRVLFWLIARYDINFHILRTFPHNHIFGEYSFEFMSIHFNKFCRIGLLSFCK